MRCTEHEKFVFLLTGTKEIHTVIIVIQLCKLLLAKKLRG